MKRSSIASVTPTAPATPSSSRSCNGDGLKRIGLKDALRTRSFRVGALGRRTAGTEAAYFESAGLPGCPIQRIACIQYALAADQRGGEVHVKLLKGAVVDQQHNRLG